MDLRIQRVVVENESEKYDLINREGKLLSFLHDSEKCELEFLPNIGDFVSLYPEIYRVEGIIHDSKYGEVKPYTTILVSE